MATGRTDMAHEIYSTGGTGFFFKSRMLGAPTVGWLAHGTLDAETRQWWRWRDQDAWQMYLANCFLGEPYLPTALADTLFGIGARDANAAQRFAHVFNKGVAPLRILTARQLADVAPSTVAKVIAESRRDKLRSLRALLGMAWFAATLVAQHPMSPWGARRYRPVAS